MKKLITIGIACLLSLSLSGCSLGSVIDRFTASDDATIQDINPESTRVYMDEIRGELQNFTGNQITLLSDEESYTFDISQATLECSNGMLAGDAVSVVYEGQLDSTNTGAVHALKVVDDYHQMTTLEDQTFRGQVQVLTANCITVKSDKNQTVTFPITGTEQYYQAGIKAGNWVYIHYKGNLVAAADGNAATADGSHTKTFSVSDVDPFNVPDPTPTPAPQEGTEVKKENKLRAVIQNIQTNVLQVSIENTTTVLNLDMSAYGLNGNELEEELMKRGIFIELVTGNILMCMTGIGNQRSDYEKLIAALKEIAGERILGSEKKKQPEAVTRSLAMKPVPVKKERIPLREAAGRVCGSSVIPYPPGIPIVCPGEVFDPEVITYIEERRRAEEKVIGLDGLGRVIVGVEK